MNKPIYPDPLDVLYDVASVPNNKPLPTDVTIYQTLASLLDLG